MVGRKVNLKFLTSKLREVGVTIVKTTEFVQGQTCRWGLAWSFVPPVRKIISLLVPEKSSLSFTLEVWICPSQFHSLVNLSLKLFVFITPSIPEATSFAHKEAWIVPMAYTRSASLVVLIPL